MRDFARRVIESEAAEHASSKAALPAAFRVCEKLRSHLTTLMGKTGFQALLARALVLGAAEEPSLRSVSLGPDGGWQGLEGMDALKKTKSVDGGGVVLLARLLGLLTAFIGEQLAVRLVREIWPKLPLDDLDLKTGDAK